MTHKIAFLFLTIGGLECNFIWNDFFSPADKNKYIICLHPKYPNKVQNHLQQHIIPNRVDTEWGDPSLVKATFLLYKYAIQDPDVSHFILLSQNSVPVTDFNSIYNELTQDIDRGYMSIVPHDPVGTGRGDFHRQWLILPRSLVKQALYNEYLIFLGYQLFVSKNHGKMPFWLDESWIFILIKQILNKNFEEFFVRTDQCKTYLDVKKVRIPFLLHSIKEYMAIRQDLKQQGYFFMRKVEGTLEEYNQTKISS